MPRCHHWRPVTDSATLHLPPGGCRCCWRPCREKLEAPGGFCTACVEALRGHTSAEVRALLAADPGCPAGVLELLALDGNLAVSQAAKANPALHPEAADWSLVPAGPAADDDWEW